MKVCLIHSFEVSPLTTSTNSTNSTLFDIAELMQSVDLFFCNSLNCFLDGSIKTPFQFEDVSQKIKITSRLHNRKHQYRQNICDLTFFEKMFINNLSCPACEKNGYANKFFQFPTILMN